MLEKCTNLLILNFNYIRIPEKDISKWMKILTKLGLYNSNERFTIDLSPIKKLKKLGGLIVRITTYVIFSEFIIGSLILLFLNR